MNLNKAMTANLQLDPKNLILSLGFLHVNLEHDKCV